jgi:hypothetical protein
MPPPTINIAARTEFLTKTRRRGGFPMVAGLLFCFWVARAEAVPTRRLEEAARALQLAEDGKQLWLGPGSQAELKGDFIARLKKEAAAGNARAEATLALCHHVGFGVAQDMATAVRGYQKAAKAGHAGAQNNLCRSFPSCTWECEWERSSTSQAGRVCVLFSPVPR